MAFKTLIPLAFLLIIMAFFASTVLATEEFAKKTGLSCGFCHENPSGGGTLTGAGEKYRAQLSGKTRMLSQPQRYVRLVVGYLHILAGVIWFGAIFYIHIMLKPAYAAKGLPRGELMLGWTGIIVVGLTGTLLTVAVMPSFGAFFDNRFGVLLFIKICLYLVMALTSAFVTFIIGPKLRKRIAAPSPAPPPLRLSSGQAPAREGNMELTIDDLAALDGKEGRKACAAVDGVIYDFSSSRLWKDGKHARHLAGMDLSSALKQAPHGIEKLEPFPKVGELVTPRPSVGEGPGKKAPGPGANRPKAAFYFMAYMNLVIIFLVIAVIALWRWWP